MRIVFFGSSTFAVPSLKAVLEAGHKVSCVVTQPDHKKGRHLHFEGTAVKTQALKAGLELYQPTCVNCCAGFLKSLDTDLFVVVSYGQILSRYILEIPKKFCVNAHASLLPKYRGAAPINWALINREETTGISVIKMSPAMDAGDIILQKTTVIGEEDSVVSLEERLARMASDLLVEALEEIEHDRYRLTPQDISAVTFAPKLVKKDGLIDWGKSALCVRDLVRGVLLWPGAFTYYKGKLLKVYKAAIAGAPGCQDMGTEKPGEITRILKEGIEVATGDGRLIIRELQIEGKRIMTAAEFILGHRISAGEVLGKKC